MSFGPWLFRYPQGIVAPAPASLPLPCLAFVAAESSGFRFGLVVAASRAATVLPQRT